MTVSICFFCTRAAPEVMNRVCIDCMREMMLRRFVVTLQRFLAPGETAMALDERRLTRTSEDWAMVEEPEPVPPEAIALYRRPVRLANDTRRFLDLNEEIASGDKRGLIMASLSTVGQRVIDMIPMGGDPQRQTTAYTRPLMPFSGAYNCQPVCPIARREDLAGPRGINPATSICCACGRIYPEKAPSKDPGAYRFAIAAARRRFTEMEPRIGPLFSEDALQGIRAELARAEHPSNFIDVDHAARTVALIELTLDDLERVMEGGGAPSFAPEPSSTETVLAETRDAQGVVFAEPVPVRVTKPLPHQAAVDQPILPSPWTYHPNYDFVKDSRELRINRVTQVAGRTVVFFEVVLDPAIRGAAYFERSVLPYESLDLAFNETCEVRFFVDLDKTAGFAYFAGREALPLHALEVNIPRPPKFPPGVRATIPERRALSVGPESEAEAEDRLRQAEALVQARDPNAMRFPRVTTRDWATDCSYEVDDPIYLVRIERDLRAIVSRNAAGPRVGRVTRPPSPTDPTLEFALDPG
jgi:hypothetical protein